MAADGVRDRREPPTVAVRRIVLLVGGFIGCVALLFGGIAVFYRVSTRDTVATTAPRDFPAPRLQPNPARDFELFQAAQTRQLAGYEWVDRARGLVHIPIERAMALVVARGAQGYDPVAGTVPAMPGASVDGAPRATPNPAVAPYGADR